MMYLFVLKSRPVFILQESPKQPKFCTFVYDIITSISFHKKVANHYVHVKSKTYSPMALIYMCFKVNNQMCTI